jgi:GntR family transcriptional regulator
MYWSVPVRSKAIGRPPVLRRAAAQPLYRQVLDHLTGEIESGRLRPDRPIPSERSLVRRFRVSRATVRQAIAEGVRRGILRRVNGRGTFVTDTTLHQELPTVTKFPELVRRLGATPRMRLIARARELADVPLARALAIEPGAPVERLSLVGFADEQPLAVYEVTLPQPLGSRIADAARGPRAGFSLFDLYARHGAKPAYLDQTFEAQVAGPCLAKRLGVRPGQAVLVTTSITYTEAGWPIDLRRATYRGDRYKFSLRRRVD